MLQLRRTRAQCLGRTVAFAALVGLVAFAAPPPAQAAFPGANGKIAFASGLPGCGSGCNPEIYAINADGTGLTNLTKDPAIDYAPAWSPDGRRLAFTRGTPDGVHAIYVMSADGTGVTRVVDGVRPAWSPDGQKIVFEGAGLETVDGNGNKTQIVSSLNGPREAAWSPDGGKIAYSAGGGGGTLGPKDIHTVNPDGTGETRITEGATTTRFDEFPNWSPDGGKIAFSSNKADDEPTTDYDIYIVNPDGTEEARVAAGSERERMPAWSPDGTKMAFSRAEISSPSDADIYVMSSDGTGQTRLTDSPAFEWDPDWQPVQGYPRPKSASPMRVSLVSAYDECTVPDRVHGPPLEHPSCSDPASKQSSPHVWVGTPEVNGGSARFVGFVRIGVALGDPAMPVDEADVPLAVLLNDVRCRAAAVCGDPNSAGPPDYAGELEARMGVRITDRDNTPHLGGAGPATTVDFPYSFTIPCTGNPDAFVGSDCRLNTTADALVPGTVKERMRAIWQLGQIEVHDTGPDGDVDTPADSHVFLRQGIFIP